MAMERTENKNSFAVLLSGILSDLKLARTLALAPSDVHRGCRLFHEGTKGGTRGSSLGMVRICPIDQKRLRALLLSAIVSSTITITCHVLLLPHILIQTAKMSHYFVLAAACDSASH